MTYTRIFKIRIETIEDSYRNNTKLFFEKVDEILTDLKHQQLRETKMAHL